MPRTSSVVRKVQLRKKMAVSNGPHNKAWPDLGNGEDREERKI